MQIKLCSKHACDIPHDFCRRIIWQSSAHSGQALAATFHSITMHAISHDSQVHQKGCIYAQLEPAEEPAAWAGVQQQQNGAHGSEEEGEEEDEEESTPEIRLVPQNESVCKWAPANCGAARRPQAP